MGNDVSPWQTISTQNNYIQINGTVLSQELINQLAPEKLIQIEEIVKSIQIAVKSNFLSCFLQFGYFKQVKKPEPQVHSMWSTYLSSLWHSLR